MRVPNTAPKGIQPPGAVHYSELDGYRGLAALLIVVFHSYVFAGNLTGQPTFQGSPIHRILVGLDGAVAGFFVLSGFIIFLPFARAAIAQQRAISTRDFLVRRALRILPLYYSAVLFNWFLRYEDTAAYRMDLVRHLTFTQIFDADYIFSNVGTSWSLAIEVFLYLFVAVFGPLAHHACRFTTTHAGRGMVLAGLIAPFCAASLAYKWWALTIAGTIGESVVAYGLPARADTFFLGMLLAVGVAMTTDAARIGERPAMLLRWCALALLLAALLLRQSNPWMGAYFHTLCGTAFILLLTSTVLGPRGSALEARLARPTPRFLGRISYSVYLWHDLVVIALLGVGLLSSASASRLLVGTLLALAATTGVGTLSYRLIERPALRLRQLLASRERATGAIAHPATTVSPVPTLGESG